MSQPVNLNRFRKQKARAAKKARADENAAKFGQTKGEKTRDDTATERAVKELDRHRLSTSSDDQDRNA